MQKIIIFKILILSFFFQNCFANKNENFLMLKNNVVNVRYGPSLNHPIKFVYKKKFLPVKIIDKKENFRRIIDHKNNSGWIHRTQLKKSSYIVALSEIILFENSTKYSEPIARIETGRLMKLEKCIQKWCKIKVEKYTGWINTDNQLWGLNK